MSNVHQEFWDKSKSSWRSRLASRDNSLEIPGDRRVERKDVGHVKYQPERVVTDNRGPGWRTRHGHMVKNQAFYRLGTGQAQNVWDDPVHCGTRTWKYWHGPRLRTDAPLMEKLDQQDDDQERLEYYKANANARRLDDLSRTRMRRDENQEFARSASWGPCVRALSENRGHGPANTVQEYNDFDRMPSKALKQVLTKSVLDKDKASIAHISKCLQKEEMWKEQYGEWKKYRRNDSLQAFSHQRSYNDTLEKMAGQPQRCQAGRITRPSLTRRLDKLSLPKKEYVPPDITRMQDFRGLIHADNSFALTKLFPDETTGHGTEPRWHETRTLHSDAPAHDLLRTDHVLTSPRSQVQPCAAPAAPHTYDFQTFPKRHTDDVDPTRYKYRVEEPPPTQTYTYTADVPSASVTRKDAAARWEESAQHMSYGNQPQEGDYPQDWRRDAGEQVHRPSVSETAPEGAMDSAYVAPRGRLRGGRGMSHELHNADECKTFVSHKGFTHEKSHTRDTPLEQRQPMERKLLDRSRSLPAGTLRSRGPGFAKSVGFSHHKEGFVGPPITTSGVVKDTEYVDQFQVPLLTEDAHLGNFAMQPPRPTCMFGSKSFETGGHPSAITQPVEDGPNLYGTASSGDYQAPDYQTY